MTPPMTPSAEVTVREWVVERGSQTPERLRPLNPTRDPLTLIDAMSEHNAAIRHLLQRAEKAEAELGECAGILGALNAWISLGMHKAMSAGGPTQELMLSDIQARLDAIEALSVPRE